MTPHSDLTKQLIEDGLKPRAATTEPSERRLWLARQLMDRRLSDEVAYGTVRAHLPSPAR